MLDILFDTPWWLPTVLIGAGAVVAYTGMQRLEKKVIRGGTAILLLGVLVAMVSYVVDTDTEKAVGRTSRLVSSAGARDWQAFEGLLDPQTTVYTLTGPAEVTAGAREIIERFDVQSVRILGTTITERAGGIDVDIRVYSEQRGMTGVTDWRLEYRKLSGNWVLNNVRALPNEQVSDERIRSAITRER